MKGNTTAETISTNDESDAQILMNYGKMAGIQSIENNCLKRKDDEMKANCSAAKKCRPIEVMESGEAAPAIEDNEGKQMMKKREN